MMVDRLSIQAIFWQLMVVDLDVTYAQLNRAMSVNFVGLAVGCVFFIPLAKKFGRRPVYLVSTALMLATSFWTSKLQTLAELYATNLLQGLAGATNESIVQITVVIPLLLNYPLLTVTDFRPLFRAPSWGNEWFVYDHGHDRCMSNLWRNNYYLPAHDKVTDSLTELSHSHGGRDSSHKSRLASIIPSTWYH